MSEARSFPLLALQGQFLSDLEAVRIANENRLRALRDDLGIVTGPEITTAEALREVFATAENEVTKDLRRALRQTPFHGWISQAVGLGDKQSARLLAIIGHPRWRYDNEAGEWQARSIAQLWSYCGYAVVNGKAPARRRGEQARYNTEARVRAFLIAESCIKQMHSPYRKVYDDGRAKYADSVHEQACVRCGPKGNPADPGSPLSDGHKHARALRLVAKTVLKDLWLAAEPVSARDPIPAPLAA